MHGYVSQDDSQEKKKRTKVFIDEINNYFSSLPNTADNERQRQETLDYATQAIEFESTKLRGAETLAKSFAEDQTSSKSRSKINSRATANQSETPIRFEESFLAEKSRQPITKVIMPSLNSQKASYQSNNPEPNNFQFNQRLERTSLDQLKSRSRKTDPELPQQARQILEGGLYQPTKPPVNPMSRSYIVAKMRGENTEQQILPVQEMSIPPKNYISNDPINWSPETLRRLELERIENEKRARENAANMTREKAMSDLLFSIEQVTQRGDLSPLQEHYYFRAIEQKAREVGFDWEATIQILERALELSEGAKLTHKILIEKEQVNKFYASFSDKAREILKENVRLKPLAREAIQSLRNP